MVFRVGNLFLSSVTLFTFGINLLDTQCGYRAFRTDVYKKIRWKSNDYGMESEMIANAGKNKLRFKQLSIRTIYKDAKKGTTPIDGIKIFLRMFKWRLGLK